MFKEKYKYFWYSWATGVPTISCLPGGNSFDSVFSNTEHFINKKLCIVLNCINNNKMKRKTSEIWYFFRAVDDTYALCNICKAKLSYKTTTTNLSKHMNRMHPNANSTASAQNRKYKILPQTSDRHRGKPRNPAQELILLNFIKKHPALLQNPSWDNRNAFESLWDQLTAELNGNGPPQKDVATWKKVVCYFNCYFMQF